MKKLMVVSMLSVLCFSGAVRLFAQEKSSITVRASALNSGVVILDVVRGDNFFKLQCNEGEQGCTA
ncbi:MAG: hypothetical protein WAK56_19980, partial [Candidatus Sulfotelmatobacter sp.]